jgi:hypothetical protein
LRQGGFETRPYMNPESSRSIHNIGYLRAARAGQRSDSLGRSGSLLLARSVAPETIEARVHNMLVRLSNALAQAERSLRSGRPLSEAAAELPAAPTKPTDAEAPAP